MKKLLSLLPVALLLSACGGEHSAAPIDDAASAMHMMQTRIDSMRAAMEDDTLYDARGAQELLDVYKAYAKANPQDSLAPEYVFRAAGLSDPLGHPEESVALYERLIKDYPTWSRVVDSYYLKALTLDKMGRKGEARTAYEEVISRYPSHQFANDAKQMIENLQYTDEELIEKFRLQNEMEAQAPGKTMSKAEQEAASKAAIEAKRKAKGM
ncbi:MAG: tetratricopeptide repeat protein [Flavobacteriales bacterium]